MGLLTIAMTVLLGSLGAGAVWLGVRVWRDASQVVTDARRQLQGMFGDDLPGSDTPPDPLGARIAGAGFAVVGVGLLVAAVVIPLTAVIG